MLPSRFGYSLENMITTTITELPLAALISNSAGSATPVHCFVIPSVGVKTQIDPLLTASRQESTLSMRILPPSTLK